MTTAGFGWQHTLRGLLLGAAGIAAVTAVIFGLKQVVPSSTLAGLYVLPVLPVAVVWGGGLGLIVAVGSAVAFDFFFFPPLFTLTPTDTHIEAILVICGVTAVVVGQLASRVRRRTREAESLAREVQRVAEEQAALRRVATLIARAAPPEEVFAAVSAEAGRVLHADLAGLGRYESDGAETVVGAWSSTGASEPFTVGTRVELGGRNMATLVSESGRPARIDDYAEASGEAADLAREGRFSAAVGAPISVEGRVWGVLSVVSTHAEALPADTEARLAGFTELVATAIANAQARVELRDRADEQAALRRVATLVARAAPPEEIFAAVTAEVGRVLSVDVTVLVRYDPDGTETTVGAWSRTGALPVAVGRQESLSGRNVTTLVFQTGRPARIDNYAATTGAIGDYARGVGIRASAGAPITAEGRLWGVMIVATTADEPLPAATEGRLAGFTELVATTIANAEARAALDASRARIVSAADTTRRRIERDLHDGIQQGLVSLILQAAAAGELHNDEADQMRAELVELRKGLVSTLDELRETARGIHPSILTEVGLGAALGSLARRCAVPVVLEFQAEERPAEPVEVAAYYVVSEALTNAVKHAEASEIEITVTSDEGALHVRVRDDGRGGADAGVGSGLVGLTDRVEALGGRLTVHSPPGAGTTVEVVLPPLAADGSPQPMPGPRQGAA
jgi:signal transduction histidine kinase